MNVAKVYRMASGKLDREETPESIEEQKHRQEAAKVIEEQHKVWLNGNGAKRLLTFLERKELEYMVKARDSRNANVITENLTKSRTYNEIINYVRNGNYTE